MADPRDDRVSRRVPRNAGRGPPRLRSTRRSRRRPGAPWARAREPRGAGRFPFRSRPSSRSPSGSRCKSIARSRWSADGTPVASGSAEYPVPRRLRRKRKSVPHPRCRRPAPAAPAQAPPAEEVPKVPPREIQAAREPKRFAPDPPRAEPPSAASRPHRASHPRRLGRLAACPLPARHPARSRHRPVVRPGPARLRRLRQPPARRSAEAVRARRKLPRASRNRRDAATQETGDDEALETPERRLERIADLRAKGLHDEADRALAEFRRAYPGYRLSEEWLRKARAALRHGYRGRFHGSVPKDLFPSEQAAEALFAKGREAVALVEAPGAGIVEMRGGIDARDAAPRAVRP